MTSPLARPGLDRPVVADALAEHDAADRGAVALAEHEARDAVAILLHARSPGHRQFDDRPARRCTDTNWPGTSLQLRIGNSA